MTKQIRKKNILKLLRNNAGNLSMSRNLWRVLTFQKYEDIGTDEPEIFNIEVRFQHHNYISLARDFYSSDEEGIIRNGAFGNEDFSFIPLLQTIVEQMKDDGYVYINKQKCDYHTDFGKEVEYDENGMNEIYIDAKKYFSQDELRFLETSITLTTKGQSWFSFVKENILSEPIGIISLIISFISIIIAKFHL